MTSDVFSKPGTFYRGNLHTHSDRSDGVLPPQEVCNRYRANGYDFIALTDHFIGKFDFPITDTRDFRQDGFTTILGAEIHSGAMENGELWHLLAVGLPQDFAPPDVQIFKADKSQESGPALAQRAVEAGAFVSIAHPQWSGLSMGDALSIECAHAVEIYNHGCHVACQRGDGFCTLELMLTAGRRLNLIATDDAHFTEPDHFGGWVMVKAESNSPEALLQSLKDGVFYSSKGPLISDLQWHDDYSLSYECSPAQSIIVQGQGSACVTVHGENMSRGRVKLDRLRDSPWARFTVVDAADRCAYSNPFWF